MDGYICLPKACLEYLPEANVWQVKILIYLYDSVAFLKNIHRVDDIADMFNLTIRDVLNALAFWDSRGLVPDYAQFLLCDRGSGDMVVSGELVSRCEGDDKLLFEELEKITRRPMNFSDIKSVLYMRDTLQFDDELILTLVRYCVCKQKNNFSYMACVGETWQKSGVCAEGVAHFCEYVDVVLPMLGMNVTELSSKDVFQLNEWRVRFRYDYIRVKMVCDYYMRHFVDEQGGNVIDKVSFLLFKITSMASSRDVAVENVFKLIDKETVFKDYWQSQKNAKKKQSTEKNSFNSFEKTDYDFEQIEAVILANN